MQHMNKKFYPIVVRTALTIMAIIATSLPAQAVDVDNVTFYGQARTSIDYVDNDEDSQAQVSNGDSRLGVRGMKELGNGLKAVFQFEVQVDLDDGGAKSGTLFSTGRNSYVGLEGGFGTVALGLFDTPYREFTDKIDIFANTLADHNTIISNIGDGDTSAEFNNREPNSINYWSPKFGGLQLKAQYRVDEDSEVSKDRYSVGAVYENGPWYATLAYDKHENEVDVLDTGGAVIASHDTDGIKLGLAYSFNEEKTRLAFIYETLSEDGAESAFDRDAYYVSLSHKIDNNILKAGYAHAGDNDLVDNSGANFYFAGLSHNLSKRTEIYSLYAQTDNDSNGGFPLGSSTSGATAPSDFGASISGISLGVIHKF